MRNRLPSLLFVLAAAAVPLAGSAQAQTPPADVHAPNVPAPWWMRDPVIASIGHVRTEVTANRASFDAQFQSVQRTAEAATAEAGARVRDLDAALRAIGAERVRLATTFSTQPLYEQYRDKEGNVQDNDRADKIDRYQVTAELQIEVRDITALEAAYAAVMAAKPTSVGQVNFRLEPDNQVKTWLYSESVKDAARRAKLGADAAGATLGRVKVIDPTGRACQTDVLAGWPSYSSGAAQATDVSYPAPADVMEPAPPPSALVVTAQRRGGRTETPLQVTLQPPRQWLEAEACVVYGLS